jgi:hypothetical protein
MDQSRLLGHPLVRERHVSISRFEGPIHHQQSPEWVSASIMAWPVTRTSAAEQSRWAGKTGCLKTCCQYCDWVLCSALNLGCSFAAAVAQREV